MALITEAFQTNDSELLENRDDLDIPVHVAYESISTERQNVNTLISLDLEDNHEEAIEMARKLFDSATFVHEIEKLKTVLHNMYLDTMTTYHDLGVLDAEIDSFNKHLSLVNNSKSVKPEYIDSLISEISTLKNKRDETNKKHNTNLSVVDELLKSSKLKSTLNVGRVCPICMTNEIDVANVPCGHALCKTCQQNPAEPCFICRSQVSSVLKLFF